MEDNRNREKCLPICSERVKKLGDMVVNLKANCSKKESTVEDLQHKLKQIIRSNVYLLIRFIFPISVVTPSRRLLTHHQ